MNTFCHSSTLQLQQRVRWHSAPFCYTDHMRHLRVVAVTPAPSISSYDFRKVCFLAHIFYIAPNKILFLPSHSQNYSFGTSSGDHLFSYYRLLATRPMRRYHNISLHIAHQVYLFDFCISQFLALFSCNVSCLDYSLTLSWPFWLHNLRKFQSSNMPSSLIESQEFQLKYFPNIVRIFLIYKPDRWKEHVSCLVSTILAVTLFNSSAFHNYPLPVRSKYLQHSHIIYLWQPRAWAHAVGKRLFLCRR